MLARRETLGTATVDVLAAWWAADPAAPRPAVCAVADRPHPLARLSALGPEVD